MIHEADFVFFPEQLFDRSQVLKAVSRQLGIPEKEISSYRIVRKSIDARKGVKFNVRLQVATKGNVFPDLRGNFDFRDVFSSKTVTIIGAGPAGYFAALQCIMSGLKPIVFERGKSVDERKFDIAALNTQHILNPESNYAFGEGGAGTYSDGKLYTRSKKRGNVTEVLQLLHYFGADEDILVEAHPHIGTDRLHAIMRNIRNKILDCGGEVYFSSKLTGLKLFSNKVVGVVINGTDEYLCDNLVLATGHSARDIYYMLNSEGVVLREKGFAMGVRVEHPQALIDSIQYKRKERGKFLPAASYSLVKQVDGRGVYSFCMCPGGKIVSALTEDNTIVVNGMSNSKRNSPFANSGIVVELRPEDYASYSDNKIFSGLEFQKTLETLAYRNGGGAVVAPAQRLEDFVNGKISANLPSVSYEPGVVSSPMHFWMPDFLSLRLREGFRQFDRQMHGFLTNEAAVVGVESRTSSPVQVVRDIETMQSLSVSNLYPCGEGAGYAGGIVSSAVDGMEVVKRIAGQI
ncbi:MAG: NAD(P)/FAD-dependent oxidoreductase [Bacteroidales bacterium]|nr:NAD(P)/FAD-dependent oxidoreductase [Bacteroidales bacterium]